LIDGHCHISTINFQYMQMHLPWADYFVKGKIILKFTLTSLPSFDSFLLLREL